MRLPVHIQPVYPHYYARILSASVKKRIGPGPFLRKSVFVVNLRKTQKELNPVFNDSKKSCVFLFHSFILIYISRN